MRKSSILIRFSMVLSLLLLKDTTAMMKKEPHEPQDEDPKCAPDFTERARKTNTYNGQLIFTSYIFECSAVIIEWEVTIMGRREPETIEFQVWRLDHNSGYYKLVGKNTNSDSVRRRRDKFTLPVVNSEQILVQPGDIAGIYLSTDGDYKIAHDGQHEESIVHQAIGETDAPLISDFNSADLDNNMLFRRILGAPIIHVTVEKVKPSQVVRMPDKTIETTMTSLATPYMSSHTSVSSVHPKTTTNVTPLPTLPTPEGAGKRKDGDPSLWEEHRNLFISVAVCGFILILSCIALITMMSVYVRARWKQRVPPERNLREATATINSGHSSMFSLLPFDTARRNNLIAFKRRQTAPKSLVTSTSTVQTEITTDGHAEAEYEDMYDFASSTKITTATNPMTGKNELLISMKENPSYAGLLEKQALKAGGPQNDLEQSENVYDVPIFATRQPPSEYEIPVSGSLEMSASYITPQSSPPVNYENITEKSNTYTEIDI